MTKTESQKRRAKQARKQQQPMARAKQTNNQQMRKQPKKRRQPNVLGEVGKVAGSVFGMPGLGMAVGTGLSRLFGRGDYRVQSNSLFSGGLPTFSTLEAPVRIRHREFLGVVTTSTSFAISNRTNLNPGLLAPIISQFSRSFTYYKFHGLVFMFNSTSSNSVGSTNTALGVTGMVVNYDPTSANFLTRQAAEEYVGSQSATPSNNMMLPVECKNNTTMLEKRFVRTSTNVPSGKTLAECDLGVFQFFADGAQATSQAGELWVTYDVEFYLPKLDVTSDPAVDTYSGSAVSGSSTNLFAGLTPMNTRMTTIDPTGTINFKQPGTYILTSSVYLTIPSVNNFNFSFSGAVYATVTGMPAGGFLRTPESESSKSHGVIIVFTVLSPGATLVCGWGNANVSYISAQIIRMPQTQAFLSDTLEGVDIASLVKSYLDKHAKELLHTRERAESSDIIDTRSK